MKASVFRLILINILLLFTLTALHSQVIYFNGNDKTIGGTVQLDSIRIINNIRWIDTTIKDNSFDIPWYTVIDNEPNMIVNSDFSVDYYPSVDLKKLLTFRIKPTKDIILQIRIYNTLGVLISSYQQYLKNKINDIEISEPLKYGVYFVIFEGGSTKQIIKFIKTDEESDNLFYNESHPFNSKLIFQYDSCTFIGYAKGYRRDTINIIPEDGETYEFQLVKLGDWEFNDWSIYLASMSFAAIVKEYRSTGAPPNQGIDSNIYNGVYESNVINNMKSDFQNFWCYKNDDDLLKYNYHFCNSTNSFRSNEFWDNCIYLNIYFDIDSLNYTIKNIKISHKYYGEDYLRDDYYKSLIDVFYIILENVPYTLKSDGSVFIEVKKNDYQSKLKEFDNDYLNSTRDGMSGIRWWKKYIDWQKLIKINNDTFFRLVLSK